MIRTAVGHDAFIDLLVEKNFKELDKRTAPDVYFRNIQSSIQHIASLKVQMDEGMPVLEAYLSQNMEPERALQMFGGRKDEELTYEEVFSSLQGYIRAQKRRMWTQWQIDYDTISKEEYAGVKISDEHIGMAIDFIEKSQGLPGAIGNLLRQWPAGGFGAVNQPTVMSTVSAIINYTDEKGVPTDPMMWPASLEQHRAAILAPGSKWGTEDDYNAAMIILTILSMQITTPGTLGANAPAIAPAPGPPQTPRAAPPPAPGAPAAPARETE